MFLIAASRSDGQNFVNGNFESSSSCTLNSCAEEFEEIGCIPEWWAYDAPGEEDRSWVKYRCYCNPASLTECDLGIRGLWLQSTQFGDSYPDNPQRYATINPYFAGNPNALYQLGFNFVPFPSDPQERDCYIHIYGANFPLSSQGSPTFLGVNENGMVCDEGDVNICYEVTMLFNADCTDEIPSITDFPYLVFSVNNSSEPPQSPDYEELDVAVRGMLDNVSICKVMEVELMDDCEKPCLAIVHNEACFDPICDEDDCYIQGLLKVQGENYESFAFDSEPWDDHIFCFDKPEENEVDFFIAARYDEEMVPFTFCFHHDFNECDDLEIEENTEWVEQSDVPSDHFNTITILAGHTLTIDAGVVVRFCENGKLIVEPEGTLNLYGTLTSNCNKGWEGVEVQGDATTNQFPLGGVYPQGIINCFDNSKIENALVAVKLWGPDYEDAGGQIYAEGANFVNNSQGLYFAPFDNYFINATKPRPYFSKIRNCTFLTNNDYTLDVPFIYNVYTNGTRGLDFRGCEFLNYQDKPEALDATSLGIGILSMDSQFDVGPSATNPANEPCPINECEKQTVFIGLGKGVEIGRIGRNRPFQIYNCLFENCNFGIVNKAVSGSKILFNEFKLGSLKPFDGNMDQIGIAMSGFLASADVQENEFSYSEDNVDYTIGIMIEEIGYENIAIRKNYFDGLSVSNEAIGLNTFSEHGSGLHYLCNENENVTMKDFYFPDSDYPDDYIRRIQGQIEVGISYSTGNEFSNTGDSDGDFANYSDGGVIYYYSEITDPEDYPDANAVGIDGKVDKTANQCSSEQSLHPHIPDEEDFDIAVSDYYSYRDDFWVAVDEEDEEAAIAFRVMMDRTIDDITRFIDYDTSNFIRDTLRIWYARDSSIVGQLQLAGDFYNAAEDEDMSAVLDAMPYEFDLDDDESLDIERVERVYNMLLDRGPELNEADFDSLYLYASLLGHASVLSKNVLASLLDTFFQPRYYIPGEISPRNGDSGNSTQLLSTVNIYPNPAKDELTILLYDTTLPGTIHFYDTFGKLVLKNNLPAQLNVIKLDNKLRPGIYFYTISDRSNIIIQGKLIVQN